MRRCWERSGLMDIKAAKPLRYALMLNNRELGKIRSPLDIYNEDAYCGKGDANKQ